MTKDEIINEFIKDIKKFEKLAYNIAGAQDADDLFQTCFLMLLEFSEEKLISYYNPTQGLKPIFIRMLCNQYKSTTSAYHKQYRKQEMELQKKKEDILLNAPISSEEKPEYFDKIQAACQMIYDNAPSPEVAELEKMVWEIYIEQGSLRKAMPAIPAPYNELLSLKDVHQIIRKFQRTIKERLNVRMV